MEEEETTIAPDPTPEVETEQNEFIADDVVDVNIDGESEDIPPEGEESEDTPSEDEPEVKHEIDYKAEYEKTQNALRKETTDKNRAFAKMRKLEKQPEKNEEVLSDDDLVAIMEQHDGDKRVQLNAMKYAVQQAVKGVEGKAVDAVKLSQVKSQIDQHVAQKYPLLLDESSPAYSEAISLKSTLNLEDHPFADYLVGSAMLADNFEGQIKQAYEKGLNEGKSKKTENNRKKNIKENKLEATTSKSTKSAPKLSSEQQKVAKSLGLSESGMKTYANFVEQEA